MDNDRLNEIRMKEKQYHNHCYDQYTLFAEGSWLHKPVRTVLDMFEHVEGGEDVRVLDLGCGVGRNGIPLAQMLRQRALPAGGAPDRTGGVMCVDLLESAIANLHRYAGQHGVSDLIETALADIAHFSIAPDAYDYVVAVSCLEHLDSEATFDRVLRDMVEGTKSGGVHCLIIATNVTETAVDSGESITPMYELLLETNALLGKLARMYRHWTVLKRTVKPYGVTIERDGRKVMLQGDVVTWAAKKRPGADAGSTPGPVHETKRSSAE